MTLSGRRALVTGGHHGIGRAVALALAEDGADVAITYRSKPEAAEACIEEIRARGRRGYAVQAKLDQLDQLEAAAEAVLAEFETVDILVHNAGLDFPGSNVADTEEA